MDKQKDLLIQDIMNNEVKVLPAEASAQQAATIMRENEIGSLIIVDPKDNEKPIGIITERDMNNRVVAENKLPSEVVCRMIMSTPVRSISPTIKLTSAMHLMATQHIKRLVVIEHQKMIGIISQSDILEIAPYMIEVLQSLANFAKKSYEAEYTAGYCQLCENWSDTLDEVDGIFVCLDCKGTKKPSEF